MTGLLFATGRRTVSSWLRAGLLSRTEDALEQADLPLRPPEALFFYFAGVALVGLLGVLILPIIIALRWCWSPRSSRS